MKAKKLALLFLSVLLVLSILPMSALAASRNLTEGAKAYIQVTNAVENDQLAAYKIIDTTYDAATNTLTHAWNSDFAAYFAGTSYSTVEAFSALTDESAELKALLADLPQYIEDNSIAAVDTQTVAAGGTATFADLAMGEYFILPSASTSVYQLMLQKVQPTAPASSSDPYTIDDVTFAAKHREVNITKVADKTSVTKNEKVTYTITVDIPTYSDEAIDKMFWVEDVMDDGLALDVASLKFTIESATVDADAYTLTTDISGNDTFKISVDNEKYNTYWKANAAKQLVITYTATLNADTTTVVNTKETNTAKFNYSFYPYTDNREEKTASEEVNTFAIKINKYRAGKPTTKLAGAKFDLYRSLTAAETAAGETGTPIPHTAGVPGKLLESGLPTDVNGVATFEKYEANGTNYTYYLVETQAPSGYNLLDNAVAVNFTDAAVEATAGIYTVDVENSDGFQLPITGGTGTVIFTVIGIVLMGGAVVLFVVSRKRSKEK